MSNTHWSLLPFFGMKNSKLNRGTVKLLLVKTNFQLAQLFALTLLVSDAGRKAHSAAHIMHHLNHDIILLMCYRKFNMDRFTWMFTSSFVLCPLPTE